MNRMKWMKVKCCVLAVCGASALFACAGKDQGSSDDEFLEGVPEQSALQLQITNDSATEGVATDADSVVADESIASVDETTEALTAANVAPELARTRQAVKNLNQALRAFLQPIVALVRDTDPTVVNPTTRLWGPVTRGATEYRFVMHRGALAHHYGWLLQGRAADTTDKYTSVAAGGITVGALPRRGTGSVGIDLDALGNIDPTVVARGKVLAAFAHGAAGAALTYALKDFSADPSAEDPIDAILQGVHLDGGYNRERLAFYGNLEDTPTDAKELVLARVRHHRGVGGRADLLVTGGDVPDGRVWVVSECWNPQLSSVFRAVLDCPGDGPGGDSCTVKSTTGMLSACDRTFRTYELPPSDPNDVMNDPESPDANLTPPTTMPNGDAP